MESRFHIFTIAQSRKSDVSEYRLVILGFHESLVNSDIFAMLEVASIADDEIATLSVLALVILYMLSKEVLNIVF